MAAEEQIKTNYEAFVQNFQTSSQRTATSLP